MRSRRIILVWLLTAEVLLCASCGERKQEAQDRERMEAEEKARREAEAANKAITDVNRRMFQKKKPDTEAPSGPVAEEPAKSGNEAGETSKAEAPPGS